MPGITAQFAKGMVADMYDYFFDNYDRVGDIASKYMATKKIKSSYWQQTSVIGMGEAKRTDEIESIEFRTPTEGYTVVGRPFKFTDGIKISYDAVDDNQKIDNMLKEAAAGWGEDFKFTKEKFLARPFNYGGVTTGDYSLNGTVNNVITDASGDGAYDGTAASPKPIFNLSGNTRSSKGGGTYYNGIASSLSATNFETLWNLMTVTNAKNEKDEKITIRPNVLIVPPSLEFTARRLLESTLIPGSMNNDKNVLQGIVDLVVNDYIDDTDSWFLGVKNMGFKILQRQEPVISFYEDKDNMCYKATCIMRVGYMFWNFRYWGGSNFATS